MDSPSTDGGGGALSLLILLTLLIPAATQAQPAPAPATPESRLEYIARFRAAYGFPSDQATIVQVEADADANHDSGIALTASEAEIVGKRQELFAEQIMGITETAQKDAGFAGLWTDVSEGYPVIVATTADPATVRTALSGPVQGGGLELRVVPVRFTYADLRSLQTVVEGELDEWRARGVEITALGVDVRQNAVRLTVVKPSADALRRLSDEYGARVVVEPVSQPARTACISRTNCGAPMKGGLHFGPMGCTSGFISRDIPYAGAWYFMTAGHCLLGKIGMTVTHNGQAIGTASSLWFGGDLDVGYIVLSAAASPGNQLFGSSTTDIRNMNAWYWNGQQTVGMIVCRSGNTSGYTCGSITATDQTVNYGGTFVHNLWATSNVGIEGDSGAPQFRSLHPNHRGFGVFSGFTDVWGYYTPMGTIYTQTGKIMCTTSAC